MDLVREPLDLVRDFEFLLVRLDVLLLLAFRGDHQHWDGDARSIFRIDHCRVACRGSFELCPGLGGEVHNLNSCVSFAREMFCWNRRTTYLSSPAESIGLLANNNEKTPKRLYKRKLTQQRPKT